MVLILVIVSALILIMVALIYKKDNSKDLKNFNKNFKTLITDIRSKLNLKELKQPSTTYFTTFRDLIPDKAISINIELGNKAFSHLLTAVDTIEITITALSTDPFIYSTNAKL